MLLIATSHVTLCLHFKTGCNKSYLHGNERDPNANVMHKIFPSHKNYKMFP